MKIRNLRSIIIISIYLFVNILIMGFSLTQDSQTVISSNQARPLAPEYTHIENLNYFHLKNGLPQMSLSAEEMSSIGEDSADFIGPKGVYNYKDGETLRYQAKHGMYQKQQSMVELKGDVKVTSIEAEYLADSLKYFFNKDLLTAQGGVRFMGLDLKSKDRLNVKSDSMRANPKSKYGRFLGDVKGTIQRKKKYEGKMSFASDELRFNGEESLANLEGDVRLERQSYKITAGKADIHLENYNKSLKYFVLNDDVKVTETINTPEGKKQRKAFSERLEGFGREEKMVLSGAPRVEQGTDVIKGYRITIRENVDLIEVDDAMSDVQVKRKEN